MIEAMVRFYRTEESMESAVTQLRRLDGKIGSIKSMNTTKMTEENTATQPVRVPYASNVPLLQATHRNIEVAISLA